ncbi:MAG: TonB-dependent receptor [Acidobacteria bacterium]|nr:TonB-dependent receptor [Acidobacteriota bacterium]
METESFNSSPGRRGRSLAILALSAALLVALHSTALAQGRQTGTIRGSVVDAQGLVLPGVTVNVRSTALQGVRTAVTDINGNFQILALPPGDYDVVFELQGFAAVNEMATVPLGGDVGVNAAMAPAGVVETIQVVGVVPTPIETTVASSNITADEVNALPTSRQPWRIAELQPGLTDNTPNAGQVTINGAFAYDNIFLVDGVDINDNLFGTANSLYVAEAIQETQVLTSGISAEYGRFSGGVINVITKSGGNDFSGSYRLTMFKPSWAAHTPFEDEPREGDLSDNLDHEYTFGGPIVRDRLWFFYSGLLTRQSGTDTFNETGIGFDTSDAQDRNQIKLTATLAPGHTLSGNYLRRALSFTDSTFGFSVVPSTISTGRRPQDLFVATYRGALTNAVFAEVQYSQKRHAFRDSGGMSTDIFDSPILTRTQALAHYNAPYFDATDPEDRNNRQITGNVTWFLSSREAGSHSVKAGFERYTSTRTGGNSQTATDWVFRTNYAVGPDGGPVVAGDELVPTFTPGPLTIGLNWLATRGAQIDIHTTSYFVNDEWALNEHFSFNLGVRGEVIDSEATGGITTVDTSSVVPRLGVAYDPLGDGRFTIQSTYSHYAGKYSEAQFAEITNVGNPDLLIGIYTGPPGQGRDFAPGFDVDNNYRIVDGSFATQNVMFDPDLKSPLTKEFTVSAGGTLGNRGHLKATYIRRRAGNFIEDFLDLSTGSTEVMYEGASYGTFVNQVFRNTDLLERNYDALQFDGRYSVTSRFQLDGSYTVQLRNEGNFEGEATNQPGVPSVAFDYPEIFTPERNYPFGRLNDFQRHKIRVWGIYNLGLGTAGDVDLAGIWRYNSGQVYSLVAGGVPLTAQQQAILEEAAYASGPTSQSLYFDARGTEDFKGYGLFDVSVQYQIPIWRTAAPYFKFELLNVFNNDNLISWDTTVDPDYDGPVDDLGLPLNYIEGPRVGEGTSANDYPPWRAGLDGGRAFLMSLGFRF